MILDTLNTFADDQAITAAGLTASTNVIDTGSTADVGPGNEVYFYNAITEAFAGSATHMAIALQTSVDEAFSAPITVMASGNVPIADLVLGVDPFSGRIPYGCKRYLRAAFTTVGGTMSAGKVYSGLSLTAPYRRDFPGTMRGPSGS